MKNATLKDLRFKIIIFSLIPVIMFFLYLIGNRGIEETILIYALVILAFCTIFIPLVFRYCYVKKVCKDALLIEGNIVKKHSISKGVYYDIKIKNTNAIVTTSSIFKLSRRFEIDDEVVICIDEKHKEAIIVWGPVH